MESLNRSQFVTRARDDPYAHMSSEAKEYVADEFDIIPVDATREDNDLKADLSWSEKHIGGGGLLFVTDYGRHRNEVDDTEEFEEFIREKIADTISSQFTKVMDDDKEQVADTLIAVSRSNGYVVVPHFK